MPIDGMSALPPPTQKVQMAKVGRVRMASNLQFSYGMHTIQRLS